MKKMHIGNIILFIASSLFFFCPPVEAQWPTSPDSAIYIGSGSYKQVVEDGQGESISCMVIILAAVRELMRVVFPFGIL